MISLLACLSPGAETLIGVAVVVGCVALVVSWLCEPRKEDDFNGR